LAKIHKTMCLAIPVKIVSIDGDEAETEIGGVRRRVSIAFTPEARVGDYVLLFYSRSQGRGLHIAAYGICHRRNR